MNYSYGIDLLKAKYYILKDKLIRLEEYMVEFPNEETDKQIKFFKPRMEQIRHCLDKLGATAQIESSTNQQ